MLLHKKQAPDGVADVTDSLSASGSDNSPVTSVKSSAAIAAATAVAKIALLCLLFLLVGCNPSKVKPEGVQVKVARVVSGQSLEVVGIGEQPTLISRLRLVSIDTPDLQQRPWGEDAKERLEEMIGKDQVILEFDVEAKDKIGRGLAYVWKNGELLNEKLIAEGYALFAPRSPNHKYDLRLERAQEWARLMGHGIWNPEEPMRLAPSEFRRQNR
jgi:micrococcal nuclease